MRTVHVEYREEPEGWSATSPELPRWTAFGQSFREVKQLAEDGIPFFLGVDPPEVAIRESLVMRPRVGVATQFGSTSGLVGERTRHEIRAIHGLTADEVRVEVA